MKKGTAKKSLTKGRKATSAKSKSKKAASARAGKSAAASAKGKKSAAIKKPKSAAPAKKTAPAKKAKTTAPKSGQSAAGNSQPLVAKQPQSKQQAALQHGMFLYTDDAWSQAYFNNNDLHSVERALFG